MESFPPLTTAPTGPLRGNCRSWDCSARKRTRECLVEGLAKETRTRIISLRTQVWRRECSVRDSVRQSLKPVTGFVVTVSYGVL